VTAQLPPVSAIAAALAATQALLLLVALGKRRPKLTWGAREAGKAYTSTGGTSGRTDTCTRAAPPAAGHM
jgi:hypothetical protein